MKNGTQILSDMNEEIKQNDKCIFQGNEGSLKVIFNNLTGENFQGQEYQNFLKNVAFRVGFNYGEVQFYQNGQLIETGTIKK